MSAAITNTNKNISTKLSLSLLLFSFSFAISANEDGIQQIHTKVLQLLSNGGGLMWVMLFASVIGLTYAIERILSLRIKNYTNNKLLQQTQKQLSLLPKNEIIHNLEQEKSLLATTLRGVLIRSCGTREDIERGIEDDLGRALWDERKNIKPIGLVASISPLIGLLGTVIGMIDAFKQAAMSGMDDPAVFAGGIYQALYTTAFGLILAIPFLILYNYLKTKSELIMRKIEDETLIFVDKVIAIKNDTDTDTDNEQIAA